MNFNLEQKFERLKKENKNFTKLNGLKRILISCPHSVEQLREGRIKFSEPQTAIIALYLNNLGYPCFIKTTNENDDANYDKDSIYKNELVDFCKQNDIQFVIDLHQLKKERPMQICLCTGGENNKNLCGKLNFLELFFSLKDKYILTINDPFSAHGENTVSSFLAKNNIPSLQIEINSGLLSNKENLNALSENIYEILKKIENICGE